VVLAFAGEGPILLIIDDLQWADELSLAFLQSLQSGTLSTISLALVATYRSEEGNQTLEALTGAPGVRRVALGRLDQEAVGAMVADMLGMPRPPEPLVRFLVKTSEGNPFFVAEYLRAAVTEGVLLRRGGRWTLSAQPDGGESAYESIPLPRSLQGLVARRLGNLSAGARALAQHAAVLGREAPTAVLKVMAGTSDDEMARLSQELVARQVLDPVGQDGYRFVHGKLREAAFESLPFEERPRVHLRAAEAIEGLPGEPDPFELAHHYRRAERPMKAFQYAYLAGRRALSAGAFREARDHLAAALEVAESYRGDAAELDAPAERAHLRRLLGEAQVVCGDHAAGIDSLRRACQEFAVPAAPRRRLAWIWLALTECVRLVLSHFLPRRAPLPPERQRQLEAAAEMNRMVSEAYLFSGRPLECIAAILLSARLADRAEAPGQRAVAYAFLAGVCGMIGLRRLEMRLVEISRGAAQAAATVVPSLWQTSAELLFVHYRNADWNTTRSRAEPVLERAAQNNLVFDRQPIDFAVAMADFEQGRLEPARARLVQIRDSSRALGYHALDVSADAALLFCDLYSGRFEAVMAGAARLAPLCRAEKLNADMFLVLSVAACARLRSGDGAGAASAADEAFGLLRRGLQLETRPLSLRALSDLADALLALCRRGPADRATAALFRRRAAVACRRLRRLAAKRAHIRPAALLQQARLYELRGRGRRARQHLDAAAAAARALEMPPFETFARLDLARHPELPLEERRAHAEEAAVAFERMGLLWHRDRAWALLRTMAEVPAETRSPSVAGAPTGS